MFRILAPLLLIVLAGCAPKWEEVTTFKITVLGQGDVPIKVFPRCRFRDAGGEWFYQDGYNGKLFKIEQGWRSHQTILIEEN